MPHILQCTQYLRTHVSVLLLAGLVTHLHSNFQLMLSVPKIHLSKSRSLISNRHQWPKMVIHTARDVEVGSAAQFCPSQLERQWKPAAMQSCMF